MNYNIAVLPGDGIGPEIMDQAIAVLEAVGPKYDLSFEYTYADVGAIAIEKHGDPYPASTNEVCQNSDAILFGAIGDPMYDNDPNAKVRPEQGLLKMRKSLGLFTNIRPVQTYPSTYHLSPLKTERLINVDYVIYRELTSGIYFGEKGQKPEDNAAYDVMYYNEMEILRIARFAYQAAMRRKNKLTLVDKANVLETSRLWRKVIQKFSKDFPDVETEYLFVDNAAMQIILNPGQFDVILTGNMFGDILSDASSVIPGSVGLLPSASIGSKVALFEPVHGSYPQGAGKDIANPTAMILCTAMMLDELGHNDAAADIRKSIEYHLQNNLVTEDINRENPLKCSEFGASVIAHL